MHKSKVEYNYKDEEYVKSDEKKNEVLVLVVKEEFIAIHLGLRPDGMQAILYAGEIYDVLEKGIVKDIYVSDLVIVNDNLEGV